MKKLIFFICSFLLILPARAGEKDKNYFEINLSGVGQKLYPRLLLEDQSNFTEHSSFGLWAEVEIAGLPYTPSAWIAQGYKLDDRYDLNPKLGLTYSYLDVKIIIGAGVSFNKSYFGPLAGFSFNNKKVYFQALGLLATYTPYKSNYTSEQECVPRIYIKDFDPNSWYRIKLLYSISNHLEMGIISERFYGTGLISEYSLSRSLKFKFMFGRELEVDESVFQFGLMLKMPNSNNAITSAEN